MDKKNILQSYIKVLQILWFTDHDEIFGTDSNCEMYHMGKESNFIFNIIQILIKNT